MLTVKTFLAQSKIHGVGCFAADLIPKGTMVWKLNLGFDRWWTEEEYKSLPDFLRYNIRDHVYKCKYTGNWIYCSDDARFFNHSDEPNVQDSGNGITDIALRDIQPGEEILCDYQSFCI